MNKMLPTFTLVEVEMKRNLYGIGVTHNSESMSPKHSKKVSKIFDKIDFGKRSL